MVGRQCSLETAVILTADVYRDIAGKCSRRHDYEQCYELRCPANTVHSRVDAYVAQVLRHVLYFCCVAAPLVASRAAAEV